MNARTLALTAIAMTAFAANSLLCRMALEAGQIDAASFSTIRMFSGAVTLLLIWAVQRTRMPLRAHWRGPATLFVYMALFTFAYITLGAATGALILFGAVQLTMFAFALRSGERFTGVAWAGLAAAISGLIYLVSPGLAAPDPIGALMMAGAGVAWGLYSLEGRGAADPLMATAANFLCATPLVLVVSLLNLESLALTTNGIVLAIASGAIASGCGYVIWYAALRGLTAGRAAAVQLSAPVIAAIGAVLLLSEPATLRLLFASIATLGGVALVLNQRAAKT